MRLVASIAALKAALGLVTAAAAAKTALLLVLLLMAVAASARRKRSSGGRGSDRGWVENLHQQ
jgi:hypothetical protein